MSDKPETIADIIAEMRDLGKLDEKSIDKIPRALMGLGLRTYSDRLEAAWKREKEAAHMRETPGNAAVMREVVELLARVILPPQEEYPAEYGGGKVPDADGWLAWIRQIQVRACNALAAPPRNCDVGTAEKQHIRFREFCRRMSPCSKCPISMVRLPGDIETSCAMIWAHMPYEEGVAK